MEVFLSARDAQELIQIEGPIYGNTTSFCSIVGAVLCCNYQILVPKNDLKGCHDTHCFEVVFVRI